MLSAGARLEREGREKSSRADAECLVRSIGNLPLAINQAASYMREIGHSFQEEVLGIYKSDEASSVRKENGRYLGVMVG